MHESLNFIFTGKDENKNEMQLKIDASTRGFVFEFLSNPYVGHESKAIRFTLQDGCKFLREYNNNFGAGSPYRQRDLYKPFNELNLTVCQDNLIRAFAVSVGFIQFWYTNEVNGNPSQIVYYDEFDKYLSDQILFDWTGDMNVQPQMYFLPIDLMKKNLNDKGERSEELNELYEMQLVQKCECNGGVSFLNYYVPFTIPDTNNISSCFHCEYTKKLWEVIVKGINKEIMRLVRNNSNWKA